MAAMLGQSLALPESNRGGHMMHYEEPELKRRKNALDPIPNESILIKEIGKMPLVSRDRVQYIGRAAESEFHLGEEEEWIDFFQHPGNQLDFR